MKEGEREKERRRESSSCLLPAVSRACSYDHCSAKAQMQSMAQKLVVLCARPASPMCGQGGSWEGGSGYSWLGSLLLLIVCLVSVSF